jgi:hypothetical protein
MHPKLENFKVGDLVNVGPNLTGDSNLGIILGFEKESTSWSLSLTRVLVKMIDSQHVWKVLPEDVELVDLHLETLNYSC